MAQQDAFLDEIDALIEKHAPTAAPAATASPGEDPVLSEVDAILAPYEVQETEREATTKALEIGKWPGDESIRPTIEKGGRKAFDAVRDTRIPQMRQVHKARETETALHEKDSFTNRATEFAKSLFGSSEPAPVAQTAPLPVPAGPSLSPSPLHTPTPRSGPLPVQQLVSNISKEDKSAAGDVVLAYKRRQIDLDEAHRQLRDIYGRYTDDPDQPDQFGHTLRDMLAQTTRRPENPEAINPESLPPIATMVERYKKRFPQEASPKVGPDKPSAPVPGLPETAPHRQPLGELGTEIIGKTDEGRPIVKNPDGSVSTERTTTVEIDGKWVNIPTMFGGKQVSDEEAVDIMTRNGMVDPETGRTMPTFDSLEDAEAAAQARSENDLGKYGQSQAIAQSQPAPDQSQFAGDTPDLTLPEVVVRPDDQASTSPSWLQPGLANNYESPEVLAPSMPRPENEAPAPQEDKPFWDDAREVGRQIVAGAVVDLPKMAGQAMQALSAEDSVANRAGKAMAEAAKLREAGWKPDMQGRGSLADAFIRGGRAIAPSVATIAAYLNPYGAVAGPLTTIALFGGSQFQEEYDKVKAAGGTDEDARNAGVITGAIQGGGELLANKLTLGMFGATKNVAREGMKRMLGEAADYSVVKPWLKATAQAMVGEPATEVAQDLGTALTEQQYGLKTEPLGKIAYDSATAAGAMTTLLAPFGLAGHYQNAQRAQAIDRILTDPSAAPPEGREAVVRMLHDEALSLKIPNADQWMAGALEDVQAGQPIRRTVTGDTGAADVPAAHEPLAQGTPASAPATVSAPPPIDGVPAGDATDAIVGLPPELQIAQGAPYLIKQQPPGQSVSSDVAPVPLGPPSPAIQRFQELFDRYTLPTAQQIAERKTAGPLPVPMPWDTVSRPADEMPTQRQVAQKKVENTASREQVDATQELPRVGSEIPILPRPEPVKKRKAQRLEVVSQPTPRERIRFEELSPDEREALDYVNQQRRASPDIAPDAVQTPAPVERPTPIERPAAQDRPTPQQRPTPVPKPDEITPEMREAMDYVNEYEVQERPAPVERPTPETKPAPVETTVPKIETKGPVVETPKPVKGPLPEYLQENIEQEEVGETTPPKADSPVSVADQQPSRFAHIDGAHNAAALELRSKAYDKERTGDVLLDNGKFVSFDHAVRLAREGIESGEVRPVPFQLYDRLGIAIRDAKRVIKEAAKPSPASDISPTVMSETTAPIDRAAHEAATSPTNDRPEPTPAQKEEGNYKKGHVTIGGLPISIENPQGSTRSGVSKSGKDWSVEMKSHYGYLKGTVGKDKDQIDAFVKPGTPESYDGPVYVVDQKDPSTDRFDEHKTVIGAGSLNEAKRIYQENYAKGWKGLQSITRFSMPEFKAWLKSGETKKPAANYTPTQHIVKSDNLEIPPAVSVPPARTPAPFPVPPKGTKTSASTSSQNSPQTTKTRTGPGTPKQEPWQMTRAEFVAHKRAELAAKAIQNPSLTSRAHSAEFGRRAEIAHAGIVEQAMADGKAVPSEVLADYPEAQDPSQRLTSQGSPEPKTTRKKASTRSKSQNEQGAPIREFTESPSAPEPSGYGRSRGIPAEADPPISSYRNNDTVKAHPDYRAAKAGDTDAAIRVVQDLVKPETLADAKRRFAGSIFVAPLAQEASGLNAIPKALAAHYANAAGGRTDSRITQTNKVFHTGADAMQRMIARPQFTGAVTRGARYVLVDDVTTMGGTFAELAHHIRQGGGEVVGIVALTNAARNEKLTPSPARIRLLEERFGDAIRETFGVEPSALTAPEAGYLSNFRDADDLRARAARAEEHRNRRLATKGLSQRQDPEVADQSGPAQEPSAPSPPSSTPTDLGSPQGETPDAEVAVATPRRVPRASLKQLTDLERQGREVADAFLAAVDHAASKPIPTRPRIPVAPILGGPPKTLANIVIDVQAGTGKKLTTGKARRGQAGVYKPSSATTLVRYSGDLDTTAHELAHALDDEYGIVKAYKGQPNSPFDAELKPFGEHGSVQTTGPRSTATYWRAEGVAEWTRAWLVNPQAAEAAAPTFTQHFKQVVPAHIQKALQAFSDDIRRHAGQSAHAKIMANVEWETPKSPLLAWLTGTRTAPGPGFQLTIGDQLATELTDRLTPFMKAVRYAQGQRNAERPLPGKDPSLLARLYMGLNAKLDDVFEHGMIDAQLQRATPGGLTWLLGPLDPQALEAEIQEVASLMIAQRTMEKARQLERDRVSGIGAGIESDVSVARARLAELKKDEIKYARLQDAASRYRQWADANLRYLVDKGRLSAEQYAAIKENNEFYVAMQRIIEVSPGEELVVSLPRGTAGKKLGTVGQPVKTFSGSTRTIKNPYHALMDATNQAIREADRNEVLSLFRDLLTMDRGMHEGQVADLASVGRLAATGEKHTIPIYKNGTKEVWQFHPDVYAALKGVEEGAYKFPWALTILPRILRATIVNAPPFALRNLIRDAWQRTIVSRVDSKPWDVLKPYSQDEITRFQRSGGDQAGHYYTGPQEYGRALQFAMRELSGKKGSILVDPARLGRGYLNLMQASERQGRMAEYRRAFQHAKKEFGYDDYHASLWAAGQARDLLDFAVAGNWTQLVNQLVPFTNAAVQGLRRNIKGARENPTGVALRFGIYALIPSLVNFAWNYLFGDGDDLDEYRELPAYQRDLFYNYKLGPDQWLSIPKAFEVGVLATTFERAMDYGLGNEKAFEGHVGAFLRTLLPIDEAAFGGPFQGIFQAVANYDFFRDRPIVPRYEENLALDLRNTHRASRLGQAIQSAIGVDARKIDFVVEQQFGYFGRYATKASDIGREEKRGFGLDTVGLFRGSPATAALDVQKIKEIATERGLVASRGKAVDKYQTVSAVPARPTEHVKNPDAVRFGVFRKLLDAYYEAKGPEAKDAAAKILRREAAALRTIWEKSPPRQQAEEKAEITRKRDTGEISKDEATKAFKEMMKPKRAYAPFPIEPALVP